MEKIFKKEDGSRVCVKVSLRSFYAESSVFVMVSTCSKGKRTWVDAYSIDSYEYRKLVGRSIKQLEEYRKECILKACPIEWIEETKAELLSNMELSF